MDITTVITRPATSLFVIAGPCVIESLDLCLEIGRHVKSVCDSLGLGYVFKASFDKANRSSNASFRGPGLEGGVKILERVKAELGVPVLTDVHESSHPAKVAPVVDLLQVPAFLARQTDLLHACGATGRAVNIKKGQFMAPGEMALAVQKVRAAQLDPQSAIRDPKSQDSALGTQHSPILLTERGTFFGYGRLVNDFTGLAVMAQTHCPVVFDVTHSTQLPAGLGTTSGGHPEYSPLLARAAVAAGVQGLFLECHPDPKNAKSDAATMLGLTDVEPLLKACADIAKLRASWS
ncbi:MAG: 3-deoxy-8-phosphooctulonate synthase [Phycisphaerae bacterium]